MRRRATAEQRRALALRHPGATAKTKSMEIGKVRAPQSLLYTTPLPSISEAPVGARVVDSGSAHVVALSFRGMFLGFFRTR